MKLPFLVAAKALIFGPPAKPGKETQYVTSYRDRLDRFDAEVRRQRDRIPKGKAHRTEHPPWPCRSWQLILDEPKHRALRQRWLYIAHKAGAALPL